MNMDPQTSPIADALDLTPAEVRGLQVVRRGNVTRYRVQNPGVSNTTLSKLRKRRLVINGPNFYALTQAGSEALDAALAAVDSD